MVQSLRRSNHESKLPGCPQGVSNHGSPQISGQAAADFRTIPHRKTLNSALM
jgi:hypothetical protein